jgi:integrase
MKVQSFVSNLIKSGEYAPGTINLIYTILKAIFRHAVSLRYLKFSPAVDAIRVPSGRKTGALGEDNILTPQEIKQFLNATEPAYKALFILAIMTGLRRGEILGLKWSDIDFDNQVILVQRSVFNNEFSDLKTNGSYRTIPMDNRLTAILMEHKINASANKLDLVFPRKDGRIMNGSYLSAKVLKRTLKKAQINKPIRFHDLRHSFATLLIFQKEHMKIIQSLMGHSDIKTTMNTYGHVLKQSLNESAVKVSNAIYGEQY